VKPEKNKVLCSQGNNIHLEKEEKPVEEAFLQWY
jgi:hypothetical protein